MTDQDLIAASSKTRDFDAVSPRVVLTWHPTDQATVYGSYGEGFRSGLNQAGFVARSFPSIPPAEPDTLKNYEIGAKSSLWDGRASVEAAVYYIDWQDVQRILNVPLRRPDGSDFFVGAFTNAASASGMGFEVAATVEPIDELRLSASFGWNDLTVDEDVLDTGVVQFAKGDRHYFSPETTGSVSIDSHCRLAAVDLKGGSRHQPVISPNSFSVSSSLQDLRAQREISWLLRALALESCLLIGGPRRFSPTTS